MFHLFADFFLFVHFMLIVFPLSMHFLGFISLLTSFCDVQVCIIFT